ncbi:MAG: GNAT family N-acetyltransferase [SAR202 cluster bacterium]|nr:GNAT family N-acetyltransferase [SAR202 cluster bacterium]
MRILPLADPDNADWHEMRHALWPESGRDQHAAELNRFVADPRFAAFLAVAPDGRAAGFAEVSLRSDYVEGCDTSPVAYLEGIYVRPGFRRRGVARLLVAAAEAWGRSRGCAEFASDADLDNAVSHEMHRRLGFHETGRVVYFKKGL